jgi:branched-chain amino acid transport system substrate-binding protein
MVGPMSLQFPKQLRAAGYKKPLIGGGTNYDEFILPSMGDEVIGDVSSFMYSSALETPKNEAFVKKYRGLYGKVPSYYSEANYTTARWIDETMKKHGGKYPGPLEFIKTMQGIKLDAVRGPVSLDDRLTAINNIYIKKVEKKKTFGYDKDELWNTVIKTYPTSASSGPTTRRPSSSSRSIRATFRRASSATSAGHSKAKQSPGARPGFWNERN